jgi:hypothetical protein
VKLQELNVDVTTRLTVSEQTAERCMRILEMYLQDNPEKCIAGGALIEGEVLPLRLEERGE